MKAGLDGFVETMTQLGLCPRVEAGLVIYGIEPVDGFRAGAVVETGVAVEELVRWPLVPPHWIHLPDTLQLARTNSQPSARAGWQMHSRQIKEWGHERSPGASWASHVRGVLSEAKS
jgi:hypothetical protein